MSGFAYGNGMNHYAGQNIRGLPRHVCDTADAACGAGAALWDRYDYDENGNVAIIEDGRTIGNMSRVMTYDPLDRLTNSQSPMYGGAANYTYNVLDNLTRTSIGGTTERDHTYCYDDSNRLTFLRNGTICNGATPSDPAIALEYDVQGNVISRAVAGQSAQNRTFTFDLGNRLRSTDGAGASSYVYDGHGLRIKDFTAAGKYSLYTRDGRLVYDNNVRTGKELQYVHLNGSLVAIRERTVATNTSAVKYQHTDALGSPVAVTNGAKTVIALEAAHHEPYGLQIRQTPDDGPGFTGHVFDTATDLNYMQQRYYDPAIGRFLSVDPVTAYDNGDYQFFNRYAYAFNNSYKFTDPDGRCPICPAVIFFVLAMTHSGDANAPAPGERTSSGSPADAMAAVPGGKALAPLRMAANAGKTHTTYTREKADGTKYSGRTSGKGTPEQQVAARTAKADHQAKTAEGYGPGRVDKNSSNADAVRGREDQLIRGSGGAQSQGGTSGNKINGISDTNPKAETYRAACKKEFGC